MGALGQDHLLARLGVGRGLDHQGAQVGGVQGRGHQGGQHQADLGQALLEALAKVAQGQDLLVRRLLEFHRLLEASCLDLGRGLRLLLHREHPVPHLLRLVLCLSRQLYPAHVEADRQESLVYLQHLLCAELDLALSW